jgi:hypothetical protein
MSTGVLKVWSDYMREGDLALYRVGPAQVFSCSASTRTETHGGNRMLLHAEGGVSRRARRHIVRPYTRPTSG